MADKSKPAQPGWFANYVKAQLEDPVGLAIGFFASSGLASGTAAFVTWVIPLEWKTPLPWLITLCGFSGGWLAWFGVRECVKAIRYKRNPPMALFEPAAGRKAQVTIKHRGEPASYGVDGRILRLLDDSANPLAAPFQGFVIRHGRESDSDTLLKDGEWANVVIAELKEFGGNVLGGARDVGLFIRRGRYGEDVHVPDRGALVELQIKLKPGPTYVQIYRVTRDRNNVSLALDSSR